MRVLHLGLTNFRNYARLELDLPAGIILLQGDNAQGKTNLLEAIHILSRVRSPRTKSDRELVSWLALDDDLPFARLVARVLKGEDTSQIELSLLYSRRSLDPDTSILRRHIRIDGVDKRARDAIGLLNAVLFLPEDINLVSGSPHPRRRYLDDAISQVDPRYYRELQQFNRVLGQRNYLLKSFRGTRRDPDQLVFWDRQLVKHGAYLITQRQAAILQLNKHVQRIHPQLTGNGEWLQLEYSSSVSLGSHSGSILQTRLPDDRNVPPASRIAFQAAEDAYTAQLQELQDQELERGVSVLGPHRDDLRFLVNGVDMNVYGSRGQQRTTALSLKLAEVEWFTEQKQDQPVLLLDDVMSELDAVHRACLADTIDKAQQVIVTTTDLAQYSPAFLERVTPWLVQAGRIELLSSP